MGSVGVAHFRGLIVSVIIILAISVYFALTDQWTSLIMFLMGFGLSYILF